LNVIEALLFIFGEYSTHIKEVEGFTSILHTLENIDPKTLQTVICPLEISLSKLMVSFTQFVEKFKGMEDIIDEIIEKLFVDATNVQDKT